MMGYAEPRVANIRDIFLLQIFTKTCIFLNANMSGITDLLLAPGALGRTMSRSL